MSTQNTLSGFHVAPAQMLLHGTSLSTAQVFFILHWTYVILMWHWPECQLCGTSIDLKHTQKINKNNSSDNHF